MNRSVIGQPVAGTLEQLEGTPAMPIVGGSGSVTENLAVFARLVGAARPLMDDVGDLRMEVPPSVYEEPRSRPMDRLRSRPMDRSTARSSTLEAFARVRRKVEREELDVSDGAAVQRELDEEYGKVSFAGERLLGRVGRLLGRGPRKDYRQCSAYLDGEEGGVEGVKGRLEGLNGAYEGIPGVVDSPDAAVALGEQCRQIKGRITAVMEELTEQQSRMSGVMETVEDYYRDQPPEAAVFLAWMRDAQRGSTMAGNFRYTLQGAASSLPGNYHRGVAAGLGKIAVNLMQEDFGSLDERLAVAPEVRDRLESGFYRTVVQPVLDRERASMEAFYEGERSRGYGRDVDVEVEFQRRRGNIEREYGVGAPEIFDDLANATRGGVKAEVSALYESRLMLLSGGQVPGDVLAQGRREITGALSTHLRGVVGSSQVGLSYGAPPEEQRRFEARREMNEWHPGERDSGRDMCGEWLSKTKPPERWAYFRDSPEAARIFGGQVLGRTDDVFVDYLTGRLLGRRRDESMYGPREIRQETAVYYLDVIASPRSVEPLLLKMNAYDDYHVTSRILDALMHFMENPRAAEGYAALERSGVENMNSMLASLRTLKVQWDERGSLYPRDRDAMQFVAEQSEGYFIHCLNSQDPSVKRLAILGLARGRSFTRANSVLGGIIANPDESAYHELAVNSLVMRCGFGDAAAAEELAIAVESGSQQMAYSTLKSLGDSIIGRPDGGSSQLRTFFDALGERREELMLQWLESDSPDMRRAAIEVAHYAPTMRVAEKLEAVVYPENPSSVSESLRKDATFALSRCVRIGSDSLVLQELSDFIDPDGAVHALGSLEVHPSQVGASRENRVKVYGQLLANNANRWSRANPTVPDGELSAFSMAAADFLVGLEEVSPTAAMTFTDYMVRGLKGDRREVDGDHRQLHPELFGEAEISGRVLELARVCPPAASLFITELMTYPERREEIMVVLHPENPVVRSFSRGELEPEPVPQVGYEAVIGAETPFFLKIALTPNGAGIIGEETRREILGEELEAGIAGMREGARAGPLEAALVRKIGEGGGGLGPDNSTDWARYVNLRKRSHVETYGSRSFQLPGAIDTVAQMHAAHDAFTDIGFIALYHGTDEEAALGITEGHIGARMRHEKGSPGAFFSVAMGEAGVYACMVSRVKPTEEDPEPGFIMEKPPAVVFYTRQNLRDAHVQIEPSYWPSENHAGRAVDVNGVMVRIPQRAGVFFQGLPYETHTMGFGASMGFIGESVQFPTLPLEVASYFKLMDGVRRETVPTGEGLVSMEDAIAGRFRARLEANPNFRTTMENIYSSMREAGYPEPKIIEVADNYVRYNLDARDPRNQVRARVMERIAAERPPMLDVALLNDYFTAYENLPDYLNPADGMERIASRIDNYIAAQQRAMREASKPSLDQVNEKARSLGREDLVLTIGNFHKVMMGERDYSSNARRENVRESMRKCNEARLVELGGVVASAMEEVNGRFDERPAPEEFTVVATSSTGRGESVPASDFDILFLTRTAGVKKAHDFYFSALREGIETRLKDRGYEAVDMGQMHGVGYNVSLEDLDVPLNREARRMGHHVEPTTMMDIVPVAGNEGLVNSFRERLGAKLTEEKEEWTGFLEMHDIRAFRRLFEEGSQQLLAGDAPHDLKLEFVRIIPFEVYYLISKNIEQMRERVGMDNLPTSTLDRLGVLRDIGVVSPEECGKLQDAFTDILMWRLRASFALNETHAEVDPLALTQVERRRFLEHIQTIREFVEKNPIPAAEKAPIVIT